MLMHRTDNYASNKFGILDGNFGPIICSNLIDGVKCFSDFTVTKYETENYDFRAPKIEITPCM